MHARTHTLWQATPGARTAARHRTRNAQRGAAHTHARDELGERLHGDAARRRLKGRVHKGFVLCHDGQAVDAGAQHQAVGVHKQTLLDAPWAVCGPGGNSRR